MATGERELVERVELCDRRGRLSPAARGWSRLPLHVANLRGRPGRKKRWDYWCIITPDVIASVTCADVDYIGLGTVWVLDRRTGREGGATVTRPFGRGVEFPDVPCTGVMHVAGRDLEITIDETTPTTRISAHGGAGTTVALVDVAIDTPDRYESMNVVIPWDDRRFQFTSKQTARPVTGSIRLGDTSWDCPPGESWAVLDLGRGVWPYANRWNWAAGAGRVDGHVIGLQFGGKWTVGTGFTENALYVDGRLSKIGEELEWTYDWEHPLRPWRVRTLSSDQVDVTLLPDHDRHDRTNLGVVSMEVHQCFGVWQGAVRTDDGVRHEIVGVRGFAEEARNRW